LIISNYLLIDKDRYYAFGHIHRSYLAMELPILQTCEKEDGCDDPGEDDDDANWFGEEQWDTLTTYSRATLGIFGSITFNVGLWDILTESRTSRYGGGEIPPPFPPTVYRSIGYTFIGLAICVSMDTFYGNGNLAGNLFPATYHQFLNKHTPLRVLRVAISMLGQMLMWA
jgi:hypothetical protein